MLSFSEILDLDDSHCEAESAFAFSSHTCWTVLNASNEDQDASAAALVKFQLSDPTKVEVVYELDDHAVSYVAASETQHTIVDVAASIFTYNGSTAYQIRFTEGDRLTRLFGMGPAKVGAVGDAGLFYVVADSKKRLVDTGHDDRLRCGYSANSSTSFIGGDRGALYKLENDRLRPIELHGDYFVSAINQARSGALLIGCDDGIALRLHHNEAEEIQGDIAQVYSIANFGGIDYWGDDQFGVFERRGKLLIPKYETGLAYNMTVNAGIMTIEAGCWIYLFDGKEWTQFQINPSKDRLIERISLDFIP